MMGSRSGAVLHGLAPRRRLLRSAAALAAVAMIAAGALPASAQEMSEEELALRAEMLAIPGVGAGQPTDADWQRVGELALGPTREVLAEGECAGVQLSFMGLNNVNCTTSSSVAC